MPCYHPIVIYQNMNKYERAKDGHLYHPVHFVQKKWHQTGYDEKIQKHLEKLQNGRRIPGEYIVPCGKCIGCRLEYSRQWANRGYLESKLWEQNYFVTLTYDDDHLPENESLNKQDMTDFMKTFRNYMANNHIQADGIRFMGCGEYGSEGNRPHLHLILFNCNLPTKSFYKPRIINHEFYYQNHIIEECWRKGIINISEASWNTIAYTARYITKKIYGADAEEHYGEKTPEFMRTSRMPGIAKMYYDQHKNEIYEKDQILIKNKHGIITTKPPRYFDKLYEKEHPKEYKKLKFKRLREGYMSELIMNEESSYGILDQKEINERTAAERSKKLIRSLEKTKKINTAERLRPRSG